VDSFRNWISGIAATLGGPGVFVAAFLDSSFVSLPNVNDFLVIVMAARDKAWMPYYAAMATAGSVVGCYVIYVLAEKGGEAFLQKRLKQAHLDRVLRLYQRHGLFALMIPALLPPPMPFKLFVLAAGVANVRPLSFVVAITVARGIRYIALGWLAVTYGDAALQLVLTRGPEVALGLVAAILAGILVWWLWNRRRAIGSAA
jgi:membrane protein YqaA with SNARE-associated domain